MAKGTRSRPRNARADVVEVFRAPKESITVAVLGALVRCRAELLVITLLVIGSSVLYSTFAWTWTLIILAVVFAGLFGWPASRRFLLARMWCVLDRHRIRSCLKQAKVRTMNRDGALPFLMWARPTHTGERIRLVMRAGCSARDIEDALDYIAPACMARSARVQTTKKQSALVYVDVIRRDPLEHTTPSVSPLFRFVGKKADQDEATVTPITAAQNGNAATSQTEPSTATGSTKDTAKHTAPTGSVVVNGEDVSDYVD